MKDATLEIDAGERFGFGENWRSFVESLSPEQIDAATASIRELFGELRGKRVADVGCGSGIFSVGAVREGGRLLAFDYDPASVETTRATLARHAGPDAQYEVRSGDVLDENFIRAIGTFDVVYAWGVLHHTGDMWRAVANTLSIVGAGGRVCVALYNDQGVRSAIWRRVKRLYNRLPSAVRPAYVAVVMAPFEAATLAYYTARGRAREYLRQWRGGWRRGMTRWTDAVDWVGGYPFEVARPDDVVDFAAARGFHLVRMRLNRSWGCNEFVFERGA